MRTRHQDYLLRVPVVPVGGLSEVGLKLDSDAPFALRLVKSRNIGVSGWRFQTPRRQYQSSNFRTDVQPNLGTTYEACRGAIVYPQMVYPVSSDIVIDIGNTTGAPILDAQLLFRGSKLFDDERNPGPGYPAQVSVLPFVYRGNTISNLQPSGNGSLSRDNQIRVRQDGDFVVRYGVCDPFTLGVEGGAALGAPRLTGVQSDGANFSNIYVQLKDEDFKPYSNVPIHINDLFGQGLPATSLDEPLGFFPGLYTPEIYLPRQRSLYMDVFREDGSATGNSALPVNLYFRFGGAKVVAR